MSWISCVPANAPCSIFPLVTATDFRTLVLVAVGELQQIAIERRTKVEEFQRRHRAGLLTLLFTDIVDSTKLKQTYGDREAVIVIQRHHAAIREAETLVEESGERYWSAELHRLRGVFLTAIGADETEIEASFCAAVRIAMQQKSISLAKRAETSYADYCRQKAGVSGMHEFRLPLQ